MIEVPAGLAPAAAACLAFVAIFGSNALMTWLRARRKPAHFGELPYLEARLSSIKNLEAALEHAKGLQAKGWEVTHIDSSQVQAERDCVVITAHKFQDAWLVRLSASYPTLDVEAWSSIADAMPSGQIPTPARIG